MRRALLACALSWMAALALASCGGGVRRTIAAPRPAPAAPADASGPIGSAHPFTFGAADPSARWVVLCQAREDSDGDGAIAAWTTRFGAEGDALRPYLIFGSGEGQAIDDFFGQSADGEELVLIQRGRLLVHHVGARRTEVLRGADIDDDAATLSTRVVSFDRQRRRIAYLVPRRREQGADVAVRTLKTGHEVRFHAPGPVAHAYFSEGGEWLLVEAVIEDTNHDGELSYARRAEAPQPRPCWRPFLGCAGIPIAGDYDREILHVAPATGGPLRVIPGRLRTVGPWVLALGPRGAIIAHGLDGSVTEWVPPTCQGELLRASAGLQRALVACRGERPDVLSIEIHGPGVHRTIGSRVVHSVRSSWGDFEVERFTTYDDRDDATYVVDMRDLREWRVPDDRRVIDTFDEGVVLVPRVGGAAKRWRWSPAEDRLEALPPAPDEASERGVFAEAKDGRRLVMLNPPPALPADPPDEQPAPTQDEGDDSTHSPAPRDFTMIVDLSPVALHRDPIPLGPLVWRRPQR